MFFTALPQESELPPWPLLSQEPPGQSPGRGKQSCLSLPGSHRAPQEKAPKSGDGAHCSQLQAEHQAFPRFSSLGSWALDLPGGLEKDSGS